MKSKKLFQIAVLIIIFLAILALTWAPESLKKAIFQGRAYANELNIKITLQGEYDKIASPTIKTKVLFYKESGLAKQFVDQPLTKVSKNIFTINIDTTGLDLNTPYALFIKPDRYVGRLFCAPTIYSASCTSPQITISAGSNTLDLTNAVLYAGDINPQDGKITAEDISKILQQIGQASTTYLSGDINSDSKVESVDYSLALYSLSKNYVDDSVLFGGTSAPTNTPAPTTGDSPTNAPTPTTGNSPTTAPTPTTGSTGGTCKATVNGKIYGSAMMQSFCSPLNNETAEKCVDSASQCTNTACIDQVIVEAKAGIAKCGSAYGATLDEAKSRATLTCQTQFVPGSCVPTPTPTISCDNNGPSC